MKILRATDHRRMPWKNGGGETVEIAIFPPGASVETFDWRVSTATVSTDGAFSVFPGIDRTLAVLEGGAIELTIGDAAAIVLAAGDAPHAFAADVPTTARLLAGPLTDLNVMTRRARFEHRVRRHVGPFDIPVSAHLRLLFCARGQTVVALASGDITLAASDCLVLDAGDADAAVSGDGHTFLIEFRAAALPLDKT